MPQREWAGGGGGGCSDEAVAMLSIVGWVVYNMTKGAGQRRRRLEADERGGGAAGQSGGAEGRGLVIVRGMGNCFFC